MIKKFEVPQIFYHIVTLRLVTIQCKEVFLRSGGHEKKNHNYIFSYMQISDHETLQPPALWIYNLTHKPDIAWRCPQLIILIIRDFGPALRRSVNFDLFLMLFITDNLGGGIHSSYLVAWGISSVLFHFLPPVETPRNIAISFEIILYASSNLIDYITKSVKSSNSGRPKREECNDCIAVRCDSPTF